MYKISGSIDISIDDLKDCITGSQLLSAQISYERAQKSKDPVYVDENYFVRYAIKEALYRLQTEAKTFDEN